MNKKPKKKKVKVPGQDLMPKKTLERKMRTLENSKGRTKQLLYISRFIDKESFQENVRRIRIEYAIPLNGFRYLKRYPAPPKKWIHHQDPVKRGSFEKELKQISKEVGLHHLTGSRIFGGYIFYNEIRPLHFHNELDLCIVTDIPEEKEHPNTIETQEDDDRLFPIAIRISPEAGLQVIIDFVKKVYNPEIVELQKKYKNPKISVGTIRKHNPTVEKRNKHVIYLKEKEGLGSKEIARKINDEFGTSLNHSDVTKITSDGKKKRKQS